MASILPPEFVPNDPATIVNAFVAELEAELGRSLQPAQVERLLANAVSYRESLIRSAINEAARLNLVRFSRGPILDYLGELVGVYRLPESRAEAKVRFTLIDGHGALVIPAGIRVQTTDGQQTFITKVATGVEAGDAFVDITCEAVASGPSANGYAIDTIAVLLDPIAGVDTVSNTTASTGGAATETDEAMKERIYLAPTQFSTAGSYGAYKFHALSANPIIVDVEVIGPESANPIAPPPGTVKIFPLIDGAAETPQLILDQVFAACDALTVRPLTDTVLVIAPTIIEYSLDVELTLLTTADQPTTEAAVLASLQAFADERKRKLGLDITEDMLTAKAMLDGYGIYSVAFPSIAGDITVLENEVAVCTGITITTVDITNG